MNDDLREIRQRADAATPGPWRWGDWSATFGTFEDPDNRSTLEQAMGRPPDEIVRRQRDDEGERIMAVEDVLDCVPADLDFIAASREDVPRLIALVEELRAVLGPLLESQVGDCPFCLYDISVFEHEADCPTRHAARLLGRTAAEVAG